MIPGLHAQHGELQLHTYGVGGVPLVNRILQRMRLEEILREHLPEDDVRTELPTARALVVLVRNLLISREPMYGVADWAALHAPDLLDLFEDQVGQLHDDRLGRCLERLFQSTGPDMILAVIRQVIKEFHLQLDELHNDSTTVSFYGLYANSEDGVLYFGRAVPTITYGHSKAKRPDLKQLLYTLTITDDGGVPIYFTSHSGNVTDDTTHIDTWNVLCQLTGRKDFLYVADCKLASQKNLQHIACRNGRFITVMPRTHGDDHAFRKRLRASPGAITWRPLWQDEDGDEDQEIVSVCTEEHSSDGGFRLLWYHSTRKAARDEETRSRNVQRAIEQLQSLRQRLLSPKTRYRERGKVAEAVQAILEERGVADWLKVHIRETVQERFRQARRGRPTEKTEYVRVEKIAYHLDWELDVKGLEEARRDDGVFPLLTNDRKLTAAEILAAYRRQPTIEKRFSQLKTDFGVAPIYLKNPARIQGLLAVYFLVLVVQTLLERELRQALAATDEPTLPLYPEERSCSRPSTRRVLDVMEPIQRHILELPNKERQDFVTQLTPLQKRIVTLLGLNPKTYGR
jgi:transposase